jgi:hypothetical protein
VAGRLTGPGGYALPTLYDPNDASAGMLLTYYGGDTVAPTGCRTTFSIVFQCGDFPFPSPVGPYQRNMHFVEQTNVCQYTAYSMSQAGCPLREWWWWRPPSLFRSPPPPPPPPPPLPAHVAAEFEPLFGQHKAPCARASSSHYSHVLSLPPSCFPLSRIHPFFHHRTECPIVNGAVCSGKGVCGFDKNVQGARCFCDDGYDESDCNTPLNPFPTGAVAGSAIGGIVLGAAGVFGWAVFAAKRAGFGAPSVEGFYGQM